MTLFGLMLWLSIEARADPDAELLRQRQIVDEAAEAVARARADGHRREIATRMASYRAAAAELERLMALQDAPVEQLTAERRAAIDTVRLAWAAGQRETPARTVLTGWLGPADARLKLLTSAYTGALAAPTSIRDGLLLDVIEQTDALAVLLAFDASVEEALSDQLELRANSLRRQGPGQSATVADEIEAVVAMQQSAEAERREDAMRQLRMSALSLRQQAVTALAGEQR